MADLTFKNVLASDGKYYDLTVPSQGVAAPVVVAAPAPAPAPAPTPAPAPASIIPMSWNAAQFQTNASSNPVTVSAGSTLQNKSIAVHGEPASIVMNGGVSTAPTTLKNVRVGQACREAVRISGGHYLIDGCYLEATGSGDDHADTIQAYAGGAAKFVITVRNSLIRAHNTAATAGFFVSDNCTGDVRLDNIVFQEGPYGLRLHADVGGNINVYAKDVTFVGQFYYDPFFFLNYGGGKVVIQQWENVQTGTISNGVLTKTGLIAKPVV